MVIREIVENFIHAYFQSPTITILDGGNTIRFSDQGPGIQEKDLALEYGTSSATEEMRQYIRGVGSGLPYAQQYMEDKGGSLTIEDNIAGGTVVTISVRPRQEAAGVARSPQAQEAQQAGPATMPVPTPQGYGQSAYAQPAGMPPYGQQPYGQPMGAPQYGQQPYRRRTAATHTTGSSRTGSRPFGHRRATPRSRDSRGSPCTPLSSRTSSSRTASRSNRRLSSLTRHRTRRHSSPCPREPCRRRRASRR